MSDNPPTTPPNRESSLDYLTDSQQTPTVARMTKPLASTSGKQKTAPTPKPFYSAYHVPTPAQRRTRSRAPSPTPSQRRRERLSRSVSRSPAPQGQEVDEDDEIEMWGDEADERHLPFIDYNAPNPDQNLYQPHSTATIAPANAAQRAVEDLQNQIIQTAKHTATKASFAEHIRDIEQGTGKLFPGNTVLGEGEPAEIPGHDQGTPVPTVPPTTTNPDTSVEHEWFDRVATAINQLAEEQEKLRKLIVHSICQSNVLGTFSATTTHEVELRLCSIEGTLAGKPGHQGPPVPSSSQKEKLDMIARKIVSIEHQVKTSPPVTGNPPGPQNKTQKTEGQGAKQKGTEDSTLWYVQDLHNLSTHRLSLWAAAISVTKWGAINNGKPESFNHQTTTERNNITAYIERALRTHFGPKRTNVFPMAPPSGVKVEKGWTKTFPWCMVNHQGEQTDCSQRQPVYPPGIDRNTKLMAAPNPTPPTDKGKQISNQVPAATMENPWIDTPKGGSTSKTTPPKSFAAAAATKPKITAPQQK